MARRRKVLPVQLQGELDAKKAKIKKPRKKRKPMTPEQKAAAVERLAKARAARAPAKQPNRPTIFANIPKDNPLSWEKTREDLQELTELLKALKAMKDSNKWQDRNKYREVEAQVLSLRQYLNTGVFTSHVYGKNMQNKIKMHCVAPAYYKDGTPKRTVGVYYNDIGTVYTKEMEIEDRPQVAKAQVRKQKKREIYYGKSE